MDKLILGLLILARLTIYEIRVIVGKNFQSMCSDSLGSIQAAMKKLLASGMVSYSEYVEKGVNKKRYSITDKGRKEFMDWLAVPADMTNFKNVELGKFLFMGLAPSEKRLELLDGMIQKLETELSYLLGVWDSAQNDNYDAEYLDGIKNVTMNSDRGTSADEIESFQLYTLRYGIDSIQFDIKWFKTLKKKIESGEDTPFPKKQPKRNDNGKESDCNWRGDRRAQCRNIRAKMRF